ncbi:hypothetical protein ACFFUB_06390 [Algimonas porphyrae]|uniref:Uncharacterized protein n=1 Tax=Algimonas porphyrae TaxID=1128113 RepID=A0ABQ5V2M0_9PROT|nr:hypothetical protein [Algimonas porphyrae]GLQ21212.1 hypothetical protein GCM10007854_21670 [Algimonas porphyrae]
MAAATRREICTSCGGLGHGMTQGLLSDRIASHCKAHDLPLARDPDAVAAWPQVGAGYYRKPDWLRDPPWRSGGQSGGQRRREAAIW